MVNLPEVFLKWNYYPRQRLVKNILEDEVEESPRFYLEFTRHNPALCTASVGENGKIKVNGKIVGVGYVVKKQYLKEKINILEDHMKKSDEKYRNIYNEEKLLKDLYEDHAKRGLMLLLKHIYLDHDQAETIMDFEKFSTVELAAGLSYSSKHTWNIVQKNKTACILFFQPPTTSFELKGWISIHLDDEYHRFVTLVHDAYHYTPPDKRGFRPVYIFHIEEVYDNSPTPNGFGRRIA